MADHIYHRPACPPRFAILRHIVATCWACLTTGPCKRRRARIAVAELERLARRRDEDIADGLEEMQALYDRLRTLDGAGPVAAAATLSLWPRDDIRRLRSLGIVADGTRVTERGWKVIRGQDSLIPEPGEPYARIPDPDRNIPHWDPFARARGECVTRAEYDDYLDGLRDTIRRSGLEPTDWRRESDGRRNGQRNLDNGGGSETQCTPSLDSVTAEHIARASLADAWRGVDGRAWAGATRSEMILVVLAALQETVTPFGDFSPEQGDPTTHDHLTPDEARDDAIWRHKMRQQGYGRRASGCDGRSCPDCQGACMGGYEPQPSARTGVAVVRKPELTYDTTGWTRCSTRCNHRGPYYVEYLDCDDVAPFFVGPDGAQAGWAICTAPDKTSPKGSRVRVTAPHSRRSADHKDAA